MMHKWERKNLPNGWVQLYCKRCGEETVGKDGVNNMDNFLSVIHQAEELDKQGCKIPRAMQVQQNQETLKELLESKL